MLHAFQGYDTLDVIEDSLMRALLWLTLIKTFNLSQENHQCFVSLASAHHPLTTTIIWLKLVWNWLISYAFFLKEANFAQSINIKFSFRGVKNSTLHKIKPWNLQMSEGEVNAVNSIFDLHELLGFNLIHDHQSN